MRMLALFFLALPACYGEIRGGNSGSDLAADAALTPDAPPDAPVEIDARAPESIDSLLIAEATNAGAFTRISKAAYTSSLGDFTINVMTNQDSRDYKKIHPEDAGSHMTMLPGTLIVRQVFDADGNITKVTLMAKGPRGYDPTLGDWWFGVTDPSGVPLSDDSGVQAGRLTACHGCHLPRADDDYLFGVPALDQR
jgi:hypothetical protein